MPLVRTLSTTPSFSIHREAVTHTTVSPFDNTGLQAVFNRGQRPIYKFDLELYPIQRWEAEYVEAFHAFHQGGKSFFFDGGPWGRMENFVLIGEGNTSNRQFFIPNRYIGTGSLRIQTENQTTLATSDWAVNSTNGWPYSLSAIPGVVTFANSGNTIPGSGFDVKAKWGCKYRVLFPPDGIKVSALPGEARRIELTLLETLLTDSGT